MKFSKVELSLIAVTLAIGMITLGYFFGRAGSGDRVVIETENTPSADSTEIIYMAKETAEASDETEKININTAGEEELETLPGIGEVIARRIIDFREEYGDFWLLRILLT